MLHFCNGSRMVSHMSTDWWDYVQDVIGDDSYTDAANRAGFDKSAFSRWRKGAKADPAFAQRVDESATRVISLKAGS